MRKRIVHLIRDLFLLLLLIYAIAPFVILFFNSVKTQKDFYINPFGAPKVFSWSNFSSAWQKGGYTEAYLNSLTISSVAIVFVVLFACMAAYALAKMKFRGNGLVMTYFVLSMSIPVSLFLVPLFFIFKTVGLMNTQIGLIIIYIAIYIPFNIVFLRSFILGIPNVIMESAGLDGCSDMGIFWRIVLPITKPALFTSMLLVFLWTWNEFFYANAFITTGALKPVSTRYLAFTGTYATDWTLVCAAGMISILPIMMAYLIFQRNFIDGLMAGSIKG